MDTNNKAPVYRKRIVVCNLPSLDPIFCVRSPIPAMVIVVHKKTAWTVRGVSCRFSRKKMGKYRMDIPDASPDMISAEMTSIGTILDDDDDVVDAVDADTVDHYFCYSHSFHCPFCKVWVLSYLQYQLRSH
mmetsp:Transcript_5888/g.8822  ORF Transcript_5888/g.8822 Transcript_5888/m.8822 type:complete len:131 (+) Transcript_5888:429-821(+)